MKTYRIATVPGDGIGKEVVPAGRQVWKRWRRRLYFRIRELRLGWRLLPPAWRDDAGERTR